MGIFLDEPKFPVIERNPTASSTISNFSFSDYIRITAMTGVSLPVGYLAGQCLNSSLTPPKTLILSQFIFQDFGSNSALRFFLGSCVYGDVMEYTALQVGV